MLAGPVELPPLTPGVDWSVCVRDAATSEVLGATGADRVQRTASVGKVFLLLEVARRIESGELDPDEELGWRDDELVEDSGLWQLLGRRTLGVADLCTLVGAVSDNLATNVLLRRVGVDPVTDLTRSLGFRRSSLLDRVRDDRGPHDPPTLSSGDASELSDLMARLHRRELVSPGVSERVRGWLAANTDLSQVASAFGLDPLAHAGPDRGLDVVNKTGTISVVRADVGVVAGPSATLAWAVLAEWTPEHPESVRDDVLAAMRAVGLVLRRHAEG